MPIDTDDLTCNNDLMLRAGRLLQEFVKRCGEGGRRDWTARLGTSEEGRAMIEHFSSLGMVGPEEEKVPEVEENVEDIDPEQKGTNEKDEKEWWHAAGKAWLTSYSD